MMGVVCGNLLGVYNLACLYKCGYLACGVEYLGLILRWC